jgi:hypothetical protein
VSTEGWGGARWETMIYVSCGPVAGSMTLVDTPNR